MAPEQILGKPVKPQTDIYALGVVLFEMLSGGELPFNGESETVDTHLSTGERIRWEHLNLAPPSVRLYNQQVSPAAERVINHCMEKDPLLRYPNCIELMKDLETAFGVPAVMPGSHPTSQGLSVASKAKKPLLGSVTGVEGASFPQPMPGDFENGKMNDRSGARLRIIPVLIGLVLLTTLVWFSLRTTITPPATQPMITLTSPQSPRRLVLQPSTQFPYCAIGRPVQSFNDQIDCSMSPAITPSTNRFVECIDFPEVLPNGQIQVRVVMHAELELQNSYIDMQPTQKGSVYLKDENQNKYEFLQVGGDLAIFKRLLNGESAAGYFIFPSVQMPAQSFAVLDNETCVISPPISVGWQ